MERRYGNSLLEAGDRWEHRRAGARHWWALLISLVLHVALFYFADELFTVRQLQTIQAPFMVSLVVPEPEPAVSVSPPVETESEPLEEVAVDPEPEVQPEPVLGDPEAVLTEEPPAEPVLDAEMEQPQLGDTLAAVPEPPVIVRRDVATEATDRLLEEMEAITPLSTRWDDGGEGDAPEPDSAAPLGATAGIEGPLGERGLLYLENPPFPLWAQEAGIETGVRFRFWVSPEGNVIRIRAVKKSSYPEFEALARQALGRWRFEPLPRGAERDEWGEVPIIWRLQRSGSGERP